MSRDEQQAIVLHEAECDEGWNDERHGRISWPTLFSSNRSPTDFLTAGVGEIEPGGRLETHQHIPPEVHHVLAGEGAVLIGEKEYPVKPGNAVFIPGNAVHGLRNTGGTPCDSSMSSLRIPSRKWITAFGTDGCGGGSLPWQAAPNLPIAALSGTYLR